MKSIPNFIEVYENIVPDELCDNIIEKFEEISKKSSVNIAIHDVYQGEFTNGGSRNRQDSAVFLELHYPDLMEQVNKALDDALSQYTSKHPGLKMLPFYNFCCKVQKTEPKQGYHVWHCEESEKLSHTLRCLVWTIYLNDVPEGEGETEFLEYGVRVTPKKGSICLFPSAWTHTHRGNPVYTHDKYIATGWYYLGHPQSQNI